MNEMRVKQCHSWLQKFSEQYDKLNFDSTSHEIILSIRNVRLRVTFIRISTVITKSVSRLLSLLVTRQQTQFHPKKNPRTNEIFNVVKMYSISVCSFWGLTLLAHGISTKF